jgi:hypothetical protein
MEAKLSHQDNAGIHSLFGYYYYVHQCLTINYTTHKHSCVKLPSDHAQCALRGWKKKTQNSNEQSGSFFVGKKLTLDHHHHQLSPLYRVFTITYLKQTTFLRYIPYILESNPHSVFGNFLNGKKLVCGSNPHLSFNHPLPTGRLIE